MALSYPLIRIISIKLTITALAWLAVLYPLWVRLETASLPGKFNVDLALALFPFFGLAAFSLLWLHAISGAFEPWLRRYLNFDRFVETTSTLILVCIVAHPLLLLTSLGFHFGTLFLYYGVLYVWIGIIGWLLLISYDIIKPLRKYTFFSKHWRAVLVISNVGFLLTFFHSLNLGEDLQTGVLRIIWIFYGTTAALAIFYTYGLKKLVKK